MQTFRKKTPLGKLRHRCFWGILWQVSQQLSCNMPLIFGYFFDYTVNLLLPLYCLLMYLTKLLWNFVSVSQICCSGCCSLSLSLSVWPNMWRTSIWWFHNMNSTIYAVWKFSLVLWSHILEPAEKIIFLCKFSFVKTKTNMYKKT